MKKNKRPIEAYFSALVLFIMLTFLTMEVVARYIFNSSFMWTEELARYLFVWFVYISASYAVYERAHIKIDSVMAIYSEKMKNIALKSGILILLIFNIFITYLSLTYSLDLLEQGNRSQVTGLLLGIFYLGVPVGFGLSSLRLVVNLFKKEEEPENDNYIT